MGDSCFFHVRGETLVKSFPFEKSEQLNSRPLLIGSNPVRNNGVWKHIQQAEGDCKAGDLFFLVTDALAAWFLKQHEAGGKPWTKLLSLHSNDDFSKFVEEQRGTKALKNDDTTLLICDWKD